MRFTTLRATTAVVLALGLAAAGATTLTGRTAAQQEGTPPPASKATDPPPKQKKDEDVVAWGRPVGGLQAGLVLRGGAKKVFRYGDVVTLGVRVRNVVKVAVTFGYVPQHLDETPPTVTDADGGGTPQPRIMSLGVAHPAVTVTLEPEATVELKSHYFNTAGREYELKPADGPREFQGRGRPLFVGTGVVAVEIERVFGDSSIGMSEVAPTLRRLGTGVLEFEVGPAEPARPKGRSGSDDPSPRPSAESLRGKWLQQSRTVNGNRQDDPAGVYLLVTADGRMKSYTPVGSGEGRGPSLVRDEHYRLDAATEPVAIDTAGRTDWADVTYGICRLENGSLTLCFAARDQPRPTRFATGAGAGMGQVQIVYTRVGGEDR